MDSSAKHKLIIFDMDNTLIHSQINFPLMKAETIRLLQAAGLKPDETQVVSQMMRKLREANQLLPEVEERIWARISEIEADGLAVAVREPGILEVLDLLAPHVHLAVLTNNMQDAAEDNLQRLALASYFEIIMGRGNVPAMKPQPEGMLAVLAHFTSLTAQDALAVGDAAIDILAATAAGIPFVAYNRSREEEWQRLSVQPVIRLTSWSSEAAEQLLVLFKEA